MVTEVLSADEPRRRGKRLLTIGLTLLFAVAAVVVGRRVLDMRESLGSLATFDRRQLVPVVLLGLAYYLLKATRWHYYLRVAGVPVPFGRAVAAYLAGQWFTFTPAGELMRGYLLGGGTRFAAVAPSIVVQALVDFVSLALMATLVVPFFPQIAPLVLPVTLPLLATAAMIASPPLRRFATGWRLLQRLNSGRKQALLHDTARLLEPRPLAVGLLLGVPTVLAGAGALLFAARAVGLVGLTPGHSVGVYSMLQLLGGISPLPQGLGVAEGSGTLFLSYIGVEPSSALAAIILFRAVTLGFSAVLGLVAFGALRVTDPSLAGTPLTGASARKNVSETASDGITPA